MLTNVVCKLWLMFSNAVNQVPMGAHPFGHDKLITSHGADALHSAHCAPDTAATSFGNQASASHGISGDEV